MGTRTASRLRNEILALARTIGRDLRGVSPRTLLHSDEVGLHQCAQCLRDTRFWIERLKERRGNTKQGDGDDWNS